MILSRSMGPRAAVEEQTLSWEEVQGWLRKVFFGGEELESSQANAERLSPVAAAHRILTNSFGLIPFGLYEVRGFISANLAAETGFDDNDLRILFEAILNMYEHDHSASKGEMAVVSPLIVFKHVGTDTDPQQRIRQAKLGCAPAHKLFELVKVTRKPQVEAPRSYRDYEAVIDLRHVPAGVQVGFQTYKGLTWGALPEDEDWFHAAE